MSKTRKVVKTAKDVKKIAIIFKLLPLIIPILLLVLFFVMVFGVTLSTQPEEKETTKNDCVGGDLQKGGIAVFEKNAKGGALEGKTDEIIKIAKKYKIPPKLFLAIIASESQWGKGLNATKQKNPLSVMGSGTIHDSYFETIEEGLEVGAKNIKTGYIDEGLNTPEKIGPKYAPTENATNDPTGMNNNWIPTVKKIMEELSSKGDKDLKCTASKSIKDIGSPVDKSLLSRVTCRIGGYGGHPGIDISTSEGTPVYSMNNGKVYETIDLFNSGGASPLFMGKDNHITIITDDNKSIYVTYRHLKKGGIKVSKGDKVKAGQLIGYSGNTGFSSGPHLHVEFLKNNEYKISAAIDWYTPLVKKLNVKSDGLGCGI